MTGCGGCAGIGSHKRWCRAVVGPLAAHYGPMSEQLESMGDSVGSNNFELANALYRVSADMRDFALLKRREHDERTSQGG